MDILTGLAFFDPRLVVSPRVLFDCAELFECRARRRVRRLLPDKALVDTPRHTVPLFHVRAFPWPLLVALLMRFEGPAVGARQEGKAAVGLCAVLQGEPETRRARRIGVEKRAVVVRRDCAADRRLLADLSRKELLSFERKQERRVNAA